MGIGRIILREADPADLQGILHVGASVRENKLRPTGPEAGGIAPQSVAAALHLDRDTRSEDSPDAKDSIDAKAWVAEAWVAEDDGQIVAFVVADRVSRSIPGLFVLPSHEGRGLAKRLLGLAMQWLWEGGDDPVWLETDKGTRAASFYQRQGFVCIGSTPEERLRFERQRPHRPES